MSTNKTQLPEHRIKRIREQGYFTQTNQEISDLAFGNRFAYQTCVSILILGVATANIAILSAMMAIAFFGVILPNHPFDYIYNHLLRSRMGKPKLPRRSIQLKFACTMATLHIGGTIYFFATGMTTMGYIFGAILIAIAGLVSTIDFCIPSIIFNNLVLKNIRRS